MGKDVWQTYTYISQIVARRTQNHPTWRHISERTPAKNLTVAAGLDVAGVSPAAMNWPDTWGSILALNHSNVTNVADHSLVLTTWHCIWDDTQSNKFKFTVKSCYLTRLNGYKSHHKEHQLKTEWKLANNETFNKFFCDTSVPFISVQLLPTSKCTVWKKCSSV